MPFKKYLFLAFVAIAGLLIFLVYQSQQTANVRIEATNPNAVPAWLEAKEQKDNGEFVPTPLTSKYLERAWLEFKKSDPSKISLGLEFTPEGAKLQEEITARNIGKKIGIYADGIQIFAPTVQEKITGSTVMISEISDRFSKDELRSLMERLNAGRGLLINPNQKKGTLTPVANPSNS